VIIVLLIYLLINIINISVIDTISFSLFFYTNADSATAFISLNV